MQIKCKKCNKEYELNKKNSKNLHPTFEYSILTKCPFCSNIEYIK